MTFLLQRLNREMASWFQLLPREPHPNIVPFVGFVKLPSGATGIVSPFFAEGAVMGYLDRERLADRYTLVCINSIQFSCFAFNLTWLLVLS